MKWFVKILDFIASLVVALALVLWLAQPAQALTLPSFPSCTQPKGDLKASYDSGIHGIVGDYREFRGSDKVYQVQENYLIQCFCPEGSGSGIQTNWVTANTFSSEDQDYLVRSGWVWIENGSLWGLRNEPYLAKNSNYACHDDGGIGGGDVLGSSTSTSHGGSVLGLADTGAFQDYMFMFTLELTLAIAAYFTVSPALASRKI